MKLTFQNFFTHFFLLDHKNQELDINDRDTALVYSISLGIFTLGTVHATCALIKWCITPADKSSEVIKRTDEVGKEAISPVQKEGEQKKEQKEGKVAKKTKEEREDAAEAIRASSSLEAPSSSAQTEKNLPQAPKTTLSWQRNTSIQKSSQEKDLEFSDLPPLWALKSNGQLDSQNPQAEEQFLDALQFLAQNPSWVKNEDNRAKVATYFTQLAKTDFSRSTHLNSILAAYQRLLTQHETLFFDLQSSTPGAPPLLALKMGEQETKIPKNLLVSQSPVYQIMLESTFKKNQQEIDLTQEGNEDLEAHFNLLSSYFLRGEIAIDSDNVLTLLDFAHQYHIPHLQEGCLKFFGTNINEIDEKDLNELLRFTTERKLDGLFVKELSQSLNGQNFVSCMRLAFKHNISSLIWNGLVFAANYPEDPTLKDFTSLLAPSHWFRSSPDKKIVHLIELGAKCVEIGTLPFVSVRNQTGILIQKDLPSSLFYFNHQEGIFWTHIREIQSLIPIEEFDAGNRDLPDALIFGFDIPGGQRINHSELSPFIKKLTSAIPNLKEIKIKFNDSKQNDKYLSYLLESLRQIEGIGFSFPYNEHDTNHYINRFKDDSLISQTGKKIQLRSLKLGNISYDEMQELFERFPILPRLEIDNALVSDFPEFPEVEFLKINSCPNITEIHIPKVRRAYIHHCKNLKKITAPEARILSCSQNKRLKTIHADNAEKAFLIDCGNGFNPLEVLTDIHFPSTTELWIDKCGEPIIEQYYNNVDDYDYVLKTYHFKTITVPEDCEIEKGEDIRCDTINRTPKTKEKRRAINNPLLPKNLHPHQAKNPQE